MNKFFLVGLLALTCTSCDHHDDRNPNRNREDYDNTGKNVRDRDSRTITPLDQSENEADITITQKLRQELVADDALSTNAKNIKIITINGVVTLRGPVDSAEEKEVIVNKLKDISGIKNVVNQLEVVENK